MRRRLAVILAALFILPASAAWAAGTPSGKSLKPCNQEDGPAPCVWDAVHMGNGSGQSYILLPPTNSNPDGRQVNLTHLEAHNLLNWSWS